MTRMTSGLLLCLCVASSNSVLAQRPLWTPIAELLVGSIGESDPVRMVTVLSRCSALNMALARLSSEMDPAKVQNIRGEAVRLIQRVIVIESRMEKERTNREADMDRMTSTVTERVRGMMGNYNQWMDHNSVNAGSYIDKEIQLEISSCQLAARLINQSQVL